MDRFTDAGQMDGWTDRQKNSLALAHPLPRGKSCSKFG